MRPRLARLREETSLRQHHLRAVDVEVHQARGLVGTRGEREGEHLVDALALALRHGEPATTGDALLEGARDRAGSLGIALARSVPTGADPPIVRLALVGELLGALVREDDVAFRVDDLEARLELVQRVREELVLERGAVACAEQGVLARPDLARGMRDDVRDAAQRRHERDDVGDGVPGGVGFHPATPSWG